MSQKKKNLSSKLYNLGMPIQCQEKWSNFIFCTFLINLFVEVWINLICICFLVGIWVVNFPRFSVNTSSTSMISHVKYAHEWFWYSYLYLGDFKGRKKIRFLPTLPILFLLKWHHWFGLLNRRSSQIAI